LDAYLNYFQNSIPILLNSIFNYFKFIKFTKLCAIKIPLISLNQLPFKFKIFKLFKFIDNILKFFQNY